MADIHLIGIVVAALVAAAVLFRLYMVLGRRTGHEPDNRPSRPVIASAARAALADARKAPEAAVAVDASTHGLLDIELADRAFDRKHFLKGARTAYETIQKAFAEGDRAALRPLLSDEVFAVFDGEMTSRTAPSARLTTVTEARIAHASLHGREAEITVAFRANFAGADNDAAREVTDHWTFARSVDAADPNWVLVATAGAAP